MSAGWTLLALHGGLALVGLALLAGPFSYAAGGDAGTCPRCRYPARHWHRVRSLREWRLLGRPALRAGDWFPWSGRVWLPSWSAALLWTTGVAEVAGNGPSALGVAALAGFAVLVVVLVTYVRRPVA